MKRAAERYPRQQTSEIDQYFAMASKTAHDDLSEAADKILVKSMVQNLRRELLKEIEETDWMFDNWHLQFNQLLITYSIGYIDTY